MLQDEFFVFARHFPDALCLITSQGQILAANEAAAKFLKKDINTLQNMSLYDLAVDDSEKTAGNLRNWSRSRQMVMGTLTLRIDGDTAKCNCNGSLVKQKTKDSPAQVLLRLENRELFSRSFNALNTKINQLKREITERRATEQELVKRKAEFEAMFRSIPDVAMFVDKDRRIVMCNPSARSMFGYDFSELVGQTTAILYADIEDFHEQGRRRYSPYQPSDESAYEVQYKRKDGSIFWGETIGTQVVDIEGKLLGFIGLIRDVSTRKKTEEELANYQEHLEQSVKERTVALQQSYQELETYSYSIAHDLRSPLRSIVGFSQILAQEAEHKLDEADMDHLKRIIQSASHMAELIDDILELSRVSRTEMELEEINISELSSDICNSLSVAYPARKVEWKIQEGMKAMGDHHLLYVVMSNLINNAWKFTQKNQDTIIEIGKKEIDGEQVFFVQDNGVGFDMKYGKKVFGLFQRMHHPDDYEGTGVGLATVDRIIKRHAGWVRIEAKPDQGATVYFTLRNDKNVEENKSGNNIVKPLPIKTKQTA